MCGGSHFSFYFSFGGYGKTTTWVVAAKVRFGVVGTQRKGTRRVVYVTARGRFEEKKATFFKKKSWEKTAMSNFGNNVSFADFFGHGFPKKECFEFSLCLSGIKFEVFSNPPPPKITKRSIFAKRIFPSF